MSGILTKTLEGFLYFSRRNGLKDLIRKPLSLEESTYNPPNGGPRSVYRNDRMASESSGVRLCLDPSL